MELKLERIALEGTKKKSAVIESELVALREDTANLRTEQSIAKSRVSELEHALNEERSKRLQDMHENERLLMLNVKLETKNENLAKNAFDANKSLLEKIQKLETATLLNESKSRVIASQSTDLNHLSDDLFRGKAEERTLHGTIINTNDDLRLLSWCVCGVCMSFCCVYFLIKTRHTSSLLLTQGIYLCRLLLLLQLLLPL